MDMEYPEQGISLTLDLKQQKTAAGGMEKPPSRQVAQNSDQMIDESTNINHEHQKNLLWQPMGQWAPMHIHKQEKRREKQIWRRVAMRQSTEHEHSVGSKELPLREVITSIPSQQQLVIYQYNLIDHAYPIRVITENKEDQLLSEHLEHKKASQNPSIYMRQTDAFNPA
jgi:hypothetical protein